MSTCFFCHSPRSSRSYYPDITFNNKKFEYRECSNCHLVYISPTLNADDLHRLYSIDYHDEFYFKAEKRYDEQVALLKKYKPVGSMMDYGCGDASFLRFFKGKGYDLNGAEYNPELVGKLKGAHDGIHFITIEELLSSDNRRYDVIHLGDVLEHLLNPAEIIEKLCSKLTPGGVLFVEGPIEHNFSFAYIFRAGYFRIRKMLQPGRTVPMRPFHVLFANRRNQREFFERIGYKTLHFEVFEWAWPFPDEWKNAKSMKLKAEYLIGKISKGGSKAVPGWGNRFYYIGTPNN